MKRICIFTIIALLLFSCTPVVKEYKQLNSREPRKTYATGELPVYSGDSLRHILFPVGGIGTGDILIGGRGEIRELEIFGQADLDELPPYMTFFSLWVKTRQMEAGIPVENPPVVKILEGRLPDDYPNPFGVPRQQLAGMPRFEQARFTGKFPFAEVQLSDKLVPLKIQLEVFNPMIPLDPDNSSLPAAVFIWNIANPGDEEVDLSVLFSMSNPFQPEHDPYSGKKTSGSVQSFDSEEYKGFTFSSPQNAPVSKNGNLTIASVRDAQTQLYGFRGNWWDNAHKFLDDFMDDGALHTESEPNTNTFSGRDVSSVWVKQTLKPGESAQIPFVISWYIPERITENSMSFGNSEAVNLTVKNYYSTLFSGSPEVVDYVFSEYDYLYNTTSRYRDILFGTKIPAYVLDALASNTAGLKTNLIMQDHQGRVHGWEGLGNDFGCCAGNCTHVWNYAQSMAFLFPSLEQKVREVSFLHDTHENGYQCFRTTFPPGEYWFKMVAADGQMGNIMRVYREWKLSGDSLWLSDLWPKVKKALEFAWKGSGQPERGYEWQNNARIPWDPAREGVMRGDQHNTYDINFYGPNTMTGSLYLGALKACAEMAAYLGENETSQEYLDLYNNGREYYETECWNGEYFIQQVEVADGIDIRNRLVIMDEDGMQEIKYQYGNGCLSDQLLGQYLAHVTGLGYLFDSAKVDAAMNAIYRYNYKPDLSHFQNVQRVYALNNEGGLLTCTWPLGVRPQFPFVYADEVWTGIEYQAAASMIWSGYVSEGLEIVKSVRDRYRGFNRNPFAEIESGRFYARAMSSWGVLLALSGFEYDGVNHSIKFDPKVNQRNFSTFWSCGSGWGEFRAGDGEIVLEVAYGELELKHLQLPGEYGAGSIKTNQSTPVEIQVENDLINIIFVTPIILTENEKLVLTAGN